MRLLGEFPLLKWSSCSLKTVTNFFKTYAWFDQKFSLGFQRITSDGSSCRLLKLPDLSYSYLLCILVLLEGIWVFTSAPYASSLTNLEHPAVPWLAFPKCWFTNCSGHHYCQRVSMQINQKALVAFNWNPTCPLKRPKCPSFVSSAHSSLFWPDLGILGICMG